MERDREIDPAIFGMEDNMEEGKIDFAQKFLRTDRDKKMTVAKEQRYRLHARSGWE